MGAMQHSPITTPPALRWVGCTRTRPTRGRACDPRRLIATDYPAGYHPAGPVPAPRWTLSIHRADYPFRCPDPGSVKGAFSDVYRLRHQRDQPHRNDRIPGGGPSAAAADDPLDLLHQGRLPAGTDLELLRRAGQVATGRLPGQGPGVDTSDLHISIDIDPAERTLTVRDNGIGMSRDEVIDLIGTIAKSGTAEMLAKLRRARESGESSEQATTELSGQFGVGFYSSFMVADRVTLVTRKVGAHTGVRWESTGEGTYTITDKPDAPQGTSVTLHLKPEDTENALHDFTNPSTVRSTVKRYSDFITWPIRMATPTKPEPSEDR